MLFSGQIVIFRANFSAPPVKYLLVRLCPDLSNYAVFIAVPDAYHGFGSAITAYSYADRQPMARK